MLELSPDERACKGVFLGFQYPVEIPGVSNSYFLKAALNAQRKSRGESELDAMDFLTLLKEKAALMEHRSQVPQPLGERRVLGRREEAQRDPPADDARTDVSPSWTRRIPAWTSTPFEGRRQRRQHAASRRTRHPGGDALPASPRLHRAGPCARAGRRAAFKSQATSPWPSSSKRRATAGSKEDVALLSAESESSCRTPTQPVGSLRSFDRGGRAARTAPALAAATCARPPCERFAALGFPSRRWEAWRYTDMDPIRTTSLDSGPGRHPGSRRSRRCAGAPAGGWRQLPPPGASSTGAWWTLCRSCTTFPRESVILSLDQALIEDPGSPRGASGRPRALRGQPDRPPSRRHSPATASSCTCRATSRWNVRSK